MSSQYIALADRVSSIQKATNIKKSTKDTRSVFLEHFVALARGKEEFKVEHNFLENESRGHEVIQ